MLGGRFDHHAAGLIQPRDGRLGLQIKMFLATDGQFSLKTMGAGSQRTLQVAAHNAHGFRMKAAGPDGIFYPQVAAHDAHGARMNAARMKAAGLDGIFYG